MEALTQIAARKQKFALVSRHETLHSAKVAMQLYDAHSYAFHHNDGARGRATTYRCVEHQHCQRFIRIRQCNAETLGSLTFAMEVTGAHSAVSTARKQNGIHPAIAVEVNAAAMSDAGPLAILTNLQNKYKDQRHLLLQLPSRSQLKSRKGYLSNKRATHTDIASFADLYQWASLRMCSSAEVFFGDRPFDRLTDETLLAGDPAGVRNGVLVLKCFQHSFEEDGASKVSFGLIFTSRRLFRNVLYAVEGQQDDGVFAAADGTYKLHYGNWVLVAFGTYRCRYTDRHVYSKNFVPWAYMFVRTEHQYAYEQLFRTVVDCAEEYFHVKLDVRFGSLDHAACIANAYKAVWPDVVLLDCYPHVTRKCREKMSLLHPSTYFQTNIEINIRQMHQTRSPEQFKAVTKLCLKRWRADGQTDYADWFQKVYLAEPWSRWYATSAIAGILPSQNALESHNGVIKTCGVAAKRAKTGVVLNDSFPRILELVGTSAPKSPFAHYCEGPVPSQMIHRALMHVAPGGNFKKFKYVNRKLVIRSLFFNSSKYIESPTCAAGEEVTTERVKRYCEAKEGTLRSDDTVLDINLHYLSLHEVQVLEVPGGTTAFCLNLEPVITADKILEIRARYRCDCKAFIATGWVCSHVLAALALANQFDLDSAVTRLPTRKLSGGQRKIPGALYVDDPGNRTLSAGNLVHRLLQQPMYPIGWQVGEDFTFEEDGVETTDFIIGRVKNVRLDGRIYKWRVAFDDGDELLYECEELVEMIVSSRRAGLDVTRSAS